MRGRVNTQDGQPAAYVSVLPKGTTKGTLTNADGTYLLRNVKEGNYTLLTRFVGLQTQEKAVSIISGQTAELNFTLLETAQQLSEVVITSQQSSNEKPVGIGKIAIRPMDLPQSVAVIDGNVLERQQALRLSDALMNVTGVYLMCTTGGYQEEIAGRGFSFGSSNTFKNGVRYFNGTLPEMSSLERIEIMKGSSAILFGNVIAGGILNLVTKKTALNVGERCPCGWEVSGFTNPSSTCTAACLAVSRWRFGLMVRTKMPAVFATRSSRSGFT
ncbi:MAG: TonB-dependent receptor [Cytophagaceae bacterium]|nr:TonB-dependent receptor [Cytophagaceae bacterium]